MLHQRAVVVLRLAGDLGADPIWQLDVLMLVPHLDLGNDQAGVLAGEHVDLPVEIAPGHDVTLLLDDRSLAQRQQRLGFQDRDWIFKLEPAQIDRTGFDRKRGAVLVQDADTDRCLAGGAQIRLPDQFPTRDVLLPTVTRYQEFTLDFETHARSSPRSNPGAGRHKIGCDVFMTVALSNYRNNAMKASGFTARCCVRFGHWPTAWDGAQDGESMHRSEPNRVD